MVALVTLAVLICPGPRPSAAAAPAALGWLLRGSTWVPYKAPTATPAIAKGAAIVAARRRRERAGGPGLIARPADRRELAFIAGSAVIAEARQRGCQDFRPGLHLASLV